MDRGKPDDEGDRGDRLDVSGFPSIKDECFHHRRKRAADQLGRHRAEATGKLSYGEPAFCRLFITEQIAEGRYIVCIYRRKR